MSKQPGITSQQAKRLGNLQRTMGERYTGNGMRRTQADIEIQRLEGVIGSRPIKTKSKYRGRQDWKQKKENERVALESRVRELEAILGER
jgi:hypothetical protein